jgi:hypothetical protein
MCFGDVLIQRAGRMVFVWQKIGLLGELIDI